ncbi:MAG: stage II sporulation protein E, partial [Alicyclobacillus sp.]|nr:stage II sporulation protein E [Alicyclobacillus sp.]
MPKRQITSADDSKARPAVPLQRWRISVTRPVLFGILGLLLGKASILHVVSPFALAYFCILTELAGRKRSWPAYAAILGAWWTGGWHGGLEQGVILTLYSLCRAQFFRRKSPDIHWVPLLAGAMDVAVKLAFIHEVWTRYDVLLALGDGALVTVLALIFIQCMPLLIGHDPNKNLRNEQLISLTILLG